MWYLVIVMLTAIYIFLNLVLPGTIGGVIESYIIRPALWILLAVIVFLISKKEGLNIWKFKKVRKWEIGKSPLHAALMIGGFQVSLLVIAGLFVGFGESPYSSTPFGIATNLVFILSALFGIELSRAYLVKKGTLTRKNITLILGLVTLLFMFINITPSEFAVLDFNDPILSIKFIGETIIPLLAMSLFASYLAYLGGALLAMGYMGVLQAFEWFSPILPNLDWALMALIGTIGPAIGFLIIQNSIQLTHGKHGRRVTRKKIKDPALPWMAVAVISVLLVFFSFGYLGVQPTVIYSGSMQPSMDVGDIIFISEVPIDEIEEGDVIQYKTANANIIHRVYEKFEEEGNTLFITKGDANDKPDSKPILPEQIAGKAVFNIPKLGWIPIFIKSLVDKVGLTIT